MILALLDNLSWGVNPEIFSLGPIELPVAISIPGLLIAAILGYLAFQQVTGKKDSSSRKKKGKEEEPESWKVWGIVIAAVVIGQVLARIMDFSTIQSVGPIAPRWYGLCFAMAFVSGYLLGARMWKDAGREVVEMENILIKVLIGTVIGARLGHVIFYDPDYYLRNLDQVLAVWNGGLASHGAAIGIIITMILITKKKAGMSFWWLADRVVIPTAVGGAFIRTGNFFNSEIYGHESDLPWAIQFTNLPGPAGMVTRHPTMLYEAILCLLVFAVLWAIYKKYKTSPPEGSLFGMFLILLFSGRFFLEYTKIPQAEFASDWALNMGQWLSVPLVLIGLYIVIKRVDWKHYPGEES